MTAASPSAPAMATGWGFGLYLFAIPLGLSGLGATWASVAAEGGPGWADAGAEVAYGLAAATWLGFIVEYLVRAARTPGLLTGDWHGSRTGPTIAFVPVVGILLSAHYGALEPAVGVWVCGAFVVLLIAVEGRLLARLMIDDVNEMTLTPAFFLPLVAGPFIAATGLARFDLAGPAAAMFGVGAFFWAVIGAVVIGRLVRLAGIAATATPTLAILFAAPATGGVAWITLTDVTGGLDPIGWGFAGVLVVMAALQIGLVPVYRALPFSLAFWGFSFPITTTANFVVHWIGGGVWTIVVALVASLAVAGLAVWSLVAGVRRARTSSPSGVGGTLSA